MPTYRELLDAAKRDIREVDNDGAARMLAAGAIPVDIREWDESSQGVIGGSLVIPRGTLEYVIESAVPDHDQPIVLYCAGGGRSAFGAQSLAQLGYRNVVSLAGGFIGWKAGGMPWEMPQALTNEAQRRYSRHILLPEVGMTGQQRLLESRVLLVGAGGLGSPAALYLAAAGVGTIGIIDDDVVDESNLQRQVIHTTGRIGTPKVESARETIVALNPGVDVVMHRERLTKANALALFAGYDLVVDGADNFPTRYLVNDACVILGKPNVHGGVARFDGQVSVFAADEGPCYRCLFRDPPPPGTTLNCAEAGVLGVVPGVIGAIQATEAIKLLLGIGEPLVGRLLVWDALEMSFRELKLRRDPSCPMCGPDGPSSLDGIEYTDYSCAIPGAH